MRKISAARQSWLILLGVFLLMWMLNAMCYRFYGDDYLYSFVWEGHAMWSPFVRTCPAYSEFWRYFLFPETALYDLGWPHGGAFLCHVLSLGGERLV